MFELLSLQASNDLEIRLLIFSSFAIHVMNFCKLLVFDDKSEILISIPRPKPET